MEVNRRVWRFGKGEKTGRHVFFAANDGWQRPCNLYGPVETSHARHAELKMKYVAPTEERAKDCFQEEENNERQLRLRSAIPVATNGLRSMETSPAARGNEDSAAKNAAGRD